MTKSVAERQPLVSVIVPAFNVAAYVEEALESVACQTLRPFEVIVVDDGSTDGTGAVLERLRLEKERLWPPPTVVHQANSGPSAARNAALRQARGTFVGFLDADDRWHPRMLERSLAALEAHGDAAVAFAWFQTIEANGRSTGWIGRPSTDSVAYQSAFTGAGIISSIVVARREALLAAGGFDETLRASENFDLWLRLLASNPAALVCVPEVLVDYRTRPGQITSDWKHMVEYWERVVSRERQRSPGFTKGLERKARANHRLNLAARASGVAAGQPARRLLLEAWLQQPAAVALSWQGWSVTAAVLVSSLPPAIGKPVFNTVRASRRRLARLRSFRRKGRSSADQSTAASPHRGEGSQAAAAPPALCNRSAVDR